MYNLNEYSKNYRKTTGNLWSYYRDEPNNPPSYNAVTITNTASFQYRNNIIGKTPNNDNDDNNTKNVEIGVPLKYLSNFWRTINIPLVNSEINLILTWSEYCILTDITTQVGVPAQEDNTARSAINASTNVTFKITDTKLYLVSGCYFINSK